MYTKNGVHPHNRLMVIVMEALQYIHVKKKQASFAVASVCSSLPPEPKCPMQGSALSAPAAHTHTACMEQELPGFSCALHLLFSCHINMDLVLKLSNLNIQSVLCQAKMYSSTSNIKAQDIELNPQSTSS